MEDFKLLMQTNYIKYASYVILERAIPDVVDGLKPVQRRILYTLHRMDDGKLHKVANVVGQTMALHPHGNAPISEALVNIANKGFLLDRQGNFGNLLTGDPAAAERYIETRLSPLARETMFNRDLTAFLPSYDSRHQEPICLPAKVPVLLLHGAEGIAVGMATRIFPHNFVELLEAEIAILEDKPFFLVPDFPSGGIMDAANYDKGKGKVKLRAKMSIRNEKTIVIEEVCYGTTTESLIRSIDEAAKKGKVKIDAIHDYTAEKVEIEIKLPRGQYAESVLDALYAFTECEVTLHSQPLVIKDDLPWETDVDQILRFHAAKLQEYLRRELEIEHERIMEKVFDKTLEQIFIENRLYKNIEQVKSVEAIHQAIEKSLVPYQDKLIRVPTYDDRERLLAIPIRRISRFDIEKNLEEIKADLERAGEIEKDLKNIKKFTIHYLQGLLKKYRKSFARRTVVQLIEGVDRRAIESKMVTIGFDRANGFIGTSVQSDNSFECTNFDKVLLLFKDGSYTVIPIPDKQYVHSNDNTVVYVGVADKQTVLSAVYRDPKTGFAYAKRFVVDKFIMEKSYRYIEPEMALEYLTSRPNYTVEVHFKPQPRQKVSSLIFELDKVPVKGVSAKGIRIASKPVKKVSPILIKAN